MNRRIIAIIHICTVLLFTSCVKSPQAEIDAAKAALEAAKTAQADLYVEADYLAVQDSLNAVMVEVEAQSSKLFKEAVKQKKNWLLLLLMLSD